LNYLTIF